MKQWFLVLCLAIASLGATAAEEKKPLNTLPQGLGLPVLVRAGLNFIELQGISENDGAFTATVDVRLRWQDLRLAYPAAQFASGYQEFVGSDAEKKLEEIWQPEVAFSNMKGDKTFQKRSLRIFPNGRVEVMQRTTASFNADFSMENFPFDRQKLAVQLISGSEPVQRVLFDFQQDELEFSNTQQGAQTEGWELGLVELSKDSVVAWRGERNTRMQAALVVKREQKSLLATIFVPLFASLLIPLLVLWLNSVEDGNFTIDAFELTNISIGGLFAVVGLNFTVNSSFVKLAAGDNPVMRLFALNYFLLGLSIAVCILLYRFNVVKRVFGPHIQEEFFGFINWAIPLLVFGTATAIVAFAIF
jgi:uncharacterized Tic20 family protein